MKSKSQLGQSLIETIVAVYILTMALVAGLALTISVLSSSSRSQTELVAVNLAREGIEVVRMMRDSNWLAGDAAGGIYALQVCADLGNRPCYPKVFEGPTYANLKTAGSYRTILNAATKTWSLDTSTNYNLYIQSDGSYTHTVAGGSYFSRKVKLSLNTLAPYSATQPEVIIKSIVGWRGKNCTVMADQDPETTNCKLTAEEHLTNWKDYK